MTIGVPFARVGAYLRQTRMTPYVERPKEEGREIGPRQLELMSFTSRHVGLPEIVG